MILSVQNNSTVEDLQDKFNECFPEFWIEFYDGQSALKKGHPADRFSRISDISFNHKIGELKIYTRSRAEQVVDNFKWQFGLLVKMFHVKNKQHIPMKGNECLMPEMLQSALHTLPGPSANA